MGFQEKRRCIHGRTEKQKCRLCDMVSRCCSAAIDIARENANVGFEYVCEGCGKKCDVMRK